MESLMVGIKMSIQLVLGQMYGAVGVFVKHVSQAPQRLSWDILVYAVLIALMLRRRCMSRKKREAAKSFAAQLEEYHKSTRKIRRTQAYEACISPPEEASPLKLQTLCLEVLHKDNRLGSLLEDFLKKEPKRELLELSFHGVMMACLEVQTCLFKESPNTPQVQVAEAKITLEVSQKNANLAEEEMLDVLVKITHPQENIQMFSQEAGKWTEGAWEMREQEQETCVKIQIHE